VGRLEEAEASYQEALRYNPRYADAHHNLGNLYLDRKAWQQAEKAYLKALEIDPKNINAQESLQRLRRDQHMQGMFSLSHLRPAQLTPLSTSQFVPASIKMLSLDDLQSKT
jgi:tetratricopeptide (TPR) repeat protein